MYKKSVAFILAMLLVVCIIPSRTSYAAISNLRFTNATCDGVTVNFDYDGVEGTTGEKYFIVQPVLYYEGHETGSGLTGRTYSIPASAGPITINRPFSDWADRPADGSRVTVRIIVWQYAEGYGFISTLDASYACTVGESSAIVDAEQARGITRLYDDHHGVVVAHQPDGAIEYWSPEGCFIGRTELAMLEDVNYGNRYMVSTYTDCGYIVDLWSLGYPTCQLQLNMYGSENGYEASFQLENQYDASTCVQ